MAEGPGNHLKVQEMEHKLEGRREMQKRKPHTCTHVHTSYDNEENTVLLLRQRITMSKLETNTTYNILFHGHIMLITVVEIWEGPP